MNTIRTDQAATIQRHQLQIRTLGTFEVRLDGQPLRLPFARCGELIVWLTLTGPNSRARIIDMLWDGSSNPSHIAYFRVVVRRTRAALGSNLGFDPLVYRHGLYQLAPALMVRADALELEATKKNASLEQLRFSFEHHLGEFMTHVNNNWVEVWQTRFADAMLSVALRFGEAVALSDPALALRAYQRAIELEPYSELAHDGLIEVYRQLGQRIELELARKVYWRTFRREHPPKPSSNGGGIALK